MNRTDPRSRAQEPLMVSGTFTRTVNGVEVESGYAYMAQRSTIKVEREGVTKCIKDWCDELGFNVDRVYGRIRRGETPQEALR